MLPVHDDPRDRPGTDDHILLLHPHGEALFYPYPYFEDDFASFVAASIAAHDQISARYLEIAEQEHLKPLCDGTHVEILVGGIEELPHALRERAQRIVEATELVSGRRVGFLRAWRHFGFDCEAAEANRSCPAA